jgi:hypothetical protein
VPDTFCQLVFHSNRQLKPTTERIRVTTCWNAATNWAPVWLALVEGSNDLAPHGQEPSISHPSAMVMFAWV